MNTALNRLAIFMDLSNFQGSYRSMHKHLPLQLHPNFWKDFNATMLSHIKSMSTHYDNREISFKGTWVFDAVRRAPRNEKEEKHRRFLDALDMYSGISVEKGYVLSNWHNGREREIEKGVDSNLIVKAMHLAHQKSYEYCLIFSDDGDYIPLVEYLRNIMGIIVFHAGFRDCELRRKSFDHIRLEDLTDQLLPRPQGQANSI